MRSSRMVFTLVIAFGLISALLGCTASNSPPQTGQTGLYQVVRVGNKELTLAAPVLVAEMRYNLIVITVKNIGAVPIAFAELEIIHLVEHPHQPGQTDEERARVVIKELPLGHVRTIYWSPAYLFNRGQVWVKVVNIK